MSNATAQMVTHPQRAPAPRKRMTPEQQRIAIAEACGWKFDPKRGNKTYPWWEPLHDETIHGLECSKSTSHKNPPDYLNDLNAMHEAEKVLTPKQAVVYRIWLMSNSDGRKATFPTVEAAMCHATAAQRAEAFLRTLGKNA